MSTIDQLLAVQQQDQKIKQLALELQEIPRRREAIARQLAGSEKKVQDAKQASMHAQSEIKDIELSVESRRQKVTQYRHQQNTASNNDIYRALEREIRNNEQEIRELEDQELDLMEALEPMKEAVTAAESELVQAQETVAAEQEGMDVRGEEVEVELATAKAEREAMVADIEPSWYARYDRTFKHTGDVALVNVMGGSCGGCHMQVPPQLVHDARRGDKITTCAYCGRMVYYKE